MERHGYLTKSFIRGCCYKPVFSWIIFILFSLSVLTPCDTMDCNTPGFPVLHYLPEFAQTLSSCIPTISSSVIPFSSCLKSFPASGSFPVSQLFTLGGWSIGVLASASVLPMNIQDRFALGLTGLISCWPRDSQESSPTPQFESIDS